LSPGAPRRSPTPDLSNSVSGCAPAQPYSLFNLFCLWVRPGAALPLISSILSPGAPRSSPTPRFFTLLSPGCAPAQRPTLSFSLFCPRVRPGAALHLIYPYSVSGCAPAQPYT
ncbi:hypothetical protein CDAR_124911, partial [Caerostris darwini]